MLDPEIGAKQNYDLINDIHPGLTNYQAVKKALQRLKKRNLKEKIITTDFSFAAESTSKEEVTATDEYERESPTKIDYSSKSLTYDEYISIFYGRKCLPWWYSGQQDRYATAIIL